MPGRMLMMQRKGRPEPAPPDDSGDEPRASERVSSVDQPPSDEGLEMAPHDVNQEGGEGGHTAVCPNCGCEFDPATGEIQNTPESGGGDVQGGGGPPMLPTGETALPAELMNQ